MSKLKVIGGQKAVGSPDQDDKGSLAASLRCLITFALICTALISITVTIYYLLT